MPHIGIPITASINADGINNQLREEIVYTVPENFVFRMDAMHVDPVVASLGAAKFRLGNRDNTLAFFDIGPTTANVGESYLGNPLWLTENQVVTIQFINFTAGEFMEIAVFGVLFPKG